ncbi:MAG: EVE domain-containing protein [Xanthomonadales bacterium]|uniref:EVE domain-containing protein n=1 Tax=Dokdonella sp. TaxID=2291710 RepID=UPI002C184685|nr:EVE domain-containing protein [Xanthomonadales bacterium]MBK7013599.1 EVE domain-containing protein [Xanthomonadales bacterium]HQW76616.1 EVE domain-containing protein [Dokdonella sp.]HQX66531.1 EVE domain-containing protein [Dokdonella sp.]HQY54965.1 EVE domain-containing protein [Dokdonella sp.]
MSRRYWLLKSEPEEFSIDALARVDIEPWSGIRNYQARNFIRDDMQVGDGILFYHSNCAEPGVVGIAEVASTAHADPTQFDKRSDYFDPASKPEKPRWLLVDVRFQRKLRRTITLNELKGRAELAEFALVRRGNRLSVLPVTRAQWDFILDLE